MFDIVGKIKVTRSAPREPLHNAVRTAAARNRAVYGVAFLANSLAIGCKKRLVAHPDPHKPSLARVVQGLPCSVPNIL